MAACGHFRIRRWAVLIGRERALSCPPVGSFSCPPTCDHRWMPKPAAKLPYRIIRLATDMFARETGFSGPEIHRLFADYTDVLGPYARGGGSPSRWQLFETGLDDLAVDDQRRFLLNLCT